jgi:hypothetical protein
MGQTEHLSDQNIASFLNPPAAREKNAAILKKGV